MTPRPLELAPQSVKAKTYILERIRFEDRGFSSPCWVWQKCLVGRGYARAAVPGLGQLSIHRATYELYVGPIPEGLTIDHLCRVKACCNPAHLEPVTARENRMRAVPYQVRKTHCKRGHELTPENLRRDTCRTCINANQRKWEKDHPRRDRREYYRQWRIRQRAVRGDIITNTLPLPPFQQRQSVDRGTVDARLFTRAP